MNLAEAIRSHDMDEIIDSMNAYAISPLKSVGIKSFNGIEPIDFVGTLFLKVLEEKRDWKKADCSFKEFLFGCLKSEISNFFKTNKYNHTDLSDEIPASKSSSNTEEQRIQIMDMLKQEGADENELKLFEYWADGINKPADISEDWKIDVKHIYNITKRLEKRLLKIQTPVKNII